MSMTDVALGTPTVIKSKWDRNGPWEIQGIMELLLTNCTKCNRLMVQSVSRSICKKCFLERMETHESSAGNDELPGEQNTCQSCGAEMDEHDMFCARCELRFMNQTRSAISELSEKLAQSPKLGAPASAGGGESRFHTHDTGIRQLGRRAGTRSYTPSTKYST